MKIVVAVDRNWAIGCKGKLLVSIPNDHKNFRELTTGRVVILGRKTLESFPGKKPLKNRRNIVLTKQPDFRVEGVTAVPGVCEALDLVRGMNPEEVFCIGGAMIYRLFLPYCDTALITRIDHIYDADAFLPDLDNDSAWEKVRESEEQVFFDLTYRFCTYKRKGRT